VQASWWRAVVLQVAAWWWLVAPRGAANGWERAEALVGEWRRSEHGGVGRAGRTIGGSGGARWSGSGAGSLGARVEQW
jgi:hypothetical protein